MEVSEKSKLKQKSVGATAASGIAWTMVQTFFGKAALFVGQLVLARILTPEDFGILGLTFTITTTFGILSDIGIGQTLQQRHPRSHLWATQAFWLTLLLSTLAALTMAVYAPLGAKFYHNEKIKSLIWIIATSMPITALATVPQAKLQSLLRFSFIAKYGSIELISAQLLTILFAWGGLGAISFALPVPILAVVRAIVYWTAAPVRLRPIRLSRGWGVMLRRSAGIFGSSVLSTATSQGDYITLGLLASAHVVGIYFFAFKLSAQPMITLAASFTNVLRPALVALKNDHRRQRDATYRTAQLLGILIVPICFLQMALAKPGLELLFGSRWLESVPLIQILSIGLPFGSISWTAATILAARGQNSRLFQYQLIGLPAFFIFVGLGAMIASAMGVAIGVTCYYIIYPICFTCAVFSKEGIKPSRILSLFTTPVIMSAVAIGAAYSISLLPCFKDRLIIQIGITSVLGGMLYAFAVRKFTPQLYLEVKHKFHALFELRS